MCEMCDVDEAALLAAYEKALDRIHRLADKWWVDGPLKAHKECGAALKEILNEVPNV